MDLDTTIGYDEDEQDAEAISMQDEPMKKPDGDHWQPGIDSLNLGCFLMYKALKMMILMILQ